MQLFFRVFFGLTGDFSLPGFLFAIGDFTPNPAKH